MTLSKEKLIRAVWEKCSKYSIPEVAEVVNKVFDAMHSSLVGGDRIEIRNFGTFKSYWRKGYMCRNPRLGTKIEVPPKKKAKFKTSIKLIKDMNNEG